MAANLETTHNRVYNFQNMECTDPNMLQFGQKINDGCWYYVQVRDEDVLERFGGHAMDLFLKRVLESSVFDYYMKNTSKPYSTGYYSYAKNYVKNFGLYPFTNEQKLHILSMNSKEEIDEYIRNIYGVAM